MIYLACDHGGFNFKEKIKDKLSKTDLEVKDVGATSLDLDDDFVDFAQLAALQMTNEDRGIFLCRNGVGVDIVANRYPQLRSVLGFNPVQVEKSRHDDNCNVLCLPADYIDAQTALSLVDIFLNTPYSAEPRFVRRLEKLDKVK